MPSVFAYIEWWYELNSSLPNTNGSRELGVGQRNRKIALHIDRLGLYTFYRIQSLPHS